MTKSELKTGMIVILASGKEYMVFKNAATCNSEQNCIVATDGSSDWLCLKGYNDDLTHNIKDENYRKFDIVQVLTVSHPYAYIRHDYDKGYRMTIWRRKEKKKYTYAQLREILGEEFEVIG